MRNWFTLLLCSVVAITAFAPAAFTQSISSKYKCRAPDYALLSCRKQAELRKLGVTPRQWDSLKNNQRLGFFNVTYAITSRVGTLDGIQVDWDFEKGIQQDRVFLRGTRAFFAIAGRSDFSRGDGSLHGDYFISFRENVFHKSVQLSFVRKRNRLDPDIDIFNPSLKDGYLIGTIFHGFEVLWNNLRRWFGGNGRTSPFAVRFKDNWECLPDKYLR